MREFDLLKPIIEAGRSLGPPVLLPPGDDMALLELRGRRVLAAVDQLVAGRHVNLDATPIDLVGRKAVARCVSDVAAMAGRPLASLVAVVLPPGFGEDRANELATAMRQAAADFGCPLVGGDIAFHERDDQPLVCSVTVLAEPVADRVVTRGDARPGDDVYVTGTLGGAVEASGLGRHLTFMPRVQEAIELLATLGDHLHAMIDISDGLGRDVSHIAERSGALVDIDATAVPHAQDLDWRRAVTDGEDYELCFTATGSVPDHLGEVPVTRVGRVLPLGDSDSRVRIRDGANVVSGDDLGWQHQA